MKLLELQLENFRSIKELTIRFNGKAMSQQTVDK